MNPLSLSTFQRIPSEAAIQDPSCDDGKPSSARSTPPAQASSSQSLASLEIPRTETGGSENDRDGTCSITEAWESATVSASVDGLRCRNLREQSDGNNSAEDAPEKTPEKHKYSIDDVLHPGVGLLRGLGSDDEIQLSHTLSPSGSRLARLGSDHIGFEEQQWMPRDPAPAQPSPLGPSALSPMLINRARRPSSSETERADQKHLDAPSSPVSPASNIVPSPQLVPPSQQAMQAPGDAPPSSQEPRFAPLTLAQVVGFAVPALGSVLADPLMSLIDTACVGQMSSVHLAALGPNTTVFGFAAMVFGFLATATTGMVARAHDHHKPVELARVVSDGLLLAAVLGTMGSIFLITCHPTILQLLNTSAALMQPAAEYLVVRAVALPASLISLVGFATCLGQRDSRTPLQVVAITGVLNLVVDLYLVLGPPAMGIFGAAVATAGSQALGAAIYLWVLTRRLDIKIQVPSFERIKPFISTGGALTLRSVCVMTSLSLLTTAAAALGTTSIAAHQVLVGVLTVAQFCPEPLSSCAQTFLASSAARFRAGRCEPAEAAFTRHAARLLLKVAVGSAAFLAALCAGLVAWAPHIFASDLVVTASVSAAAPLLGAVVGVYTLVCVMDGLIFASGDLGYSCVVQVINLPLVVLLLGAVAKYFEMALVHIWVVLLVLQVIRFGQNASRLYGQYV